MDNLEAGEQRHVRTTITIDDDAITLARELADMSGLTLGQAVSLLIREGAAARREQIAYPGDFRPLPARPGESMITLELVNRLRDELP